MDDESILYATYPTPIDGKATELYIGRQVYWRQFPKRNSSAVIAVGSTREDSATHESIKNAFCHFNHLNDEKGLMIQFWAPVKTFTGKWVLSSSGQPFALVHFNTRVRRYKLFCDKYKYVVNNKPDVVENEPMHLLVGPVADTFLNHSPNVVLDTSTQQWGRNPLLSFSFECELNNSIFLPVFSSQSERTCLGVVECSIKQSNRLTNLYCHMKDALENAGLSIYPPSIYPQTIETLKPATSHVTAEKALRLVCQTHDLTLGHVWWIPKETQTQLVYLVKSGSYYNDAASGQLLSAIAFYDSCPVIPLKIGEDLIGKTLQTLKPQFCKNVSKLDRGNGLLGLLSANCSCLTIPLTSKQDTDFFFSERQQDTDFYVFEFLWPENREHHILNEALLTTLERHFPSFKFPSPSQIVDNQVCVQGIDNSTGNRKGNTLSESTRSVKRKLEEDMTKSLDDDVVIVARYLENVTLFLLPSTSTFANAKRNISMDFHLSSLQFTLEDERDDGSCLRIDDNESFEACIAWGRTNRSHIKLRVHPRH